MGAGCNPSHNAGHRALRCTLCIRTFLNLACSFCCMLVASGPACGAAAAADADMLLALCSTRCIV